MGLQLLLLEMMDLSFPDGETVASRLMIRRIKLCFGRFMQLTEEQSQLSMQMKTIFLVEDRKEP